MFDHKRMKVFLDVGYVPSIYVDVDFTLLFGDDDINKALVRELRKVKEQYGNKIDLIVWSSGGKEYAKKCVDLAGMNDIVDYCLSKPMFMIDDQGKDLWYYNLTQFIDDFPIGRE